MSLNSDHLNSAYAKGMELELAHSYTFHQQGIPLLISSKLLRQYDCGQIDLSRLTKKKGDTTIEILEIKSSYGPGAIQKMRLYRSATLLSQLLSLTSVSTVAIGQKEALQKT